MTDLLKQQIFNKLQNIIFKDGTNLTDIISNIIIKGQNIGFSIDISEQNQEEAQEIKVKAIDKLSEIAGIGKITIIFTSSKSLDKKPQNIKNSPQKAKHFIENVKKVILVASGKGGVGKSTVAALIAEQLNKEGHRVGIVDADIYGPSIPQIFGINEVPQTINQRIIPLISRNIQIISIGFFVKDYSAIIWRGPMASKTIYQLLSVTKWDNLDYLIIDMPPGTGDIHLSILENYHLNGVIIVTTPQKMSQIDVIRSIDLYQKLSLSILGIIENMSYLSDPSSGKILNIFDGNSGKYFSDKYNIPLIHKIPIMPELANACDKGLRLTDIINLPGLHL
ncbi:Mrp/NBP35 family ATP-binding protein [Rickettsia endosymbiont of Polydrusus tereticollis]|uniref:Mrp/NBP35 family ATP-binding protein n=1 Tax=Rickettsia endosymbiont of Polydrusus tereticollis TaxID=3066251 RepID=UPI003132C2FD